MFYIFVFYEDRKINIKEQRIKTFPHRMPRGLGNTVVRHSDKQGIQPGTQRNHKTLSVYGRALANA